MGLLFVADPHIGNHKRWAGVSHASINQRCREGLDVLQRVCGFAESQGARLVIAGDLVLTEKPEPQVLTVLQKILQQCSKKPIVLVGNHDLASTSPGDHALGPLKACEIVDVPRTLDTEGFSLWCVPYRPQRVEEWLPEVLERLANGAGDSKRVLVLHQGLRGPNVDKHLRKQLDAVDVTKLETLCKRFKVSSVYAGHWHWPEHWARDVKIKQLGTLIPHSFSDTGLQYGQAVLLDSLAKTAMIHQFSGPRFLKVSSKDELYTAIAGLDDYPLYIHGEAKIGQIEELTDALERLQSEGRIRGWEAVVDRKSVEKAAKKAAEGATSARTLEKAVTEYIAKMSLPPKVTRVEVEKRTLSYL